MLNISDLPFSLFFDLVNMDELGTSYLSSIFTDDYNETKIKI